MLNCGPATSSSSAASTTGSLCRRTICCLNAFQRLPNQFTTKFWAIRTCAAAPLDLAAGPERFRHAGSPTFRLDAECGGDAVRYVAQAVLAETFREQVGTGYLAEDAGGFRPTVKGALHHDLSGVVAGREPPPLAGAAPCRAVAGRVGSGAVASSLMCLRAPDA